MCARQVAVTLHPMALVERKKTLPYPPVASSTASPACAATSPLTMSRVTMPLAWPSTTTRSSISVRGYIFTPPAAISFSSAW